MNAQDLKNSILQLAIQGKLVEQREEEGTAKELLKKIDAEKKLLIKEGKIKKQKTLPEIKEDEIPFDIPESWEWVRLGNLCNYGKSNSTPAKNIPKDAWLLDLEDIEKDSGKVLNKKRMQDVKSTSSKHIFKEGDVLYSKLRPYLNKVVIADEDGYSTSEILPLDFGTHVYNRYAQTVLMSPYFINYTVKCSYGVKMPRLGTTDGQLAVFPLPPLEEQKRIVAKIKELMPYVDKYDVAYSEVEELNKKFPEDMQKSILQYAIQGKLVEQREEDGTAEDLYKQIQEEKKKLIKEGRIKKTKALPEISEEEIPFDIPESWKWVRLQDITIFENGDRSSKYPKESDYVTNGIPFFGAKDMGEEYMKFDDVRFISKDKFKELGNGKLQDGDVVCLLRGSVGKMARFQSNERYNTGFICAQMLILRFLNKEVIDYISYAIKSPMFKTVLESKITGTAVRQLPAAELAKVIVPLPPLEEQKRIVLKVKEMLPYCQQLVK
ncbi:restriction endonuclease subunit S [Priestia flexa]|uniref:restriction endonuclease subunit S n=1 Tax=Priestia flexa TaxID=86664 RepID=UPI003CFC811A